MSLTERLAILINVNGAAAVGELKKVGDAAEKELGLAENRSQRMGAKFTQVGIGMMATAATIGAGLYAAGKGAAELEQSVGGTEAVFESSSGVISTWAKGADTAAGLSEQAARRLTTQIGGALQGLGFAQDQAAEQSINLTQIGADLAATYGGTVPDAVSAMGSALRGEFDPLEQFNIFLKQSTVDAKAVELGLAKSTSEVDANARAQATLAMITEQSGVAQGQFAKEANTASGQMAIMEAQTQNAKDALGAGMLPVMSKVAGVLGGAASGFLEFDESMGGAASTSLAVGVGVLGAAGAISTMVGWVIKLKSGLADAVSAASSFGRSLLTVDGAIRGISFAGAAAGVYLLTQRMQANREEADKWAGQFGSSGTIPEQIAATEEALRKAREESEKFASVDVFGASVWGSNEGREKADQVDALERQLEELRATETSAANAADLNARGVDAMGNEIEGATSQVDDMAAAVQETEKAYSDAAKAQDSFWNPGFDLGEAEIRATQAHHDLSQSLIENGATFDLATEAGRNNRTAFMDSTQAAIEYGQKIIEAGGSTQEATTAVLGHVAGLRDQLLAAGMSREAVDLYIAALKLTPADIATQFHTPGLVKANADAAALQAKLEWLKANGNVTVTSDGRLTRDGSGPGRASGGSAMPGSVHPIGEGRSEVVETPTGSVLVMGNEAASVRPVDTAQGGGSMTVINQLVVEGRVLAEVLNEFNTRMN